LCIHVCVKLFVFILYSCVVECLKNILCGVIFFSCSSNYCHWYGWQRSIWITVHCIWGSSYWHPKARSKMVGICSTIWLKIISLNLYCFLQLSDVGHRYHDGAEITSSEHVKLSESGESYKLELKDAQLSDSGIYKCKIVNRLGEKTHEAKLSLICKFSFSG
jgi:hypothetical protein